MIQSIKNKWNVFEQKWEHALWFKASRLCVKSLVFLCGIAMMIVGGFLWFFFGGDESGEESDFKGATHQDDRSADDIWKLTSGNDYYNQDPPDRFS